MSPLLPALASNVSLAARMGPHTNHLLQRLLHIGERRSPDNVPQG